jgi:hypothetical protein
MGVKRAGSLWGALLAAVLWAGAVPEGAAQDSDVESEPRAQEIVDTRLGVRIPKPSGWVISEPTRGALGLFRSATDPSSQIEIRVSANISAEARLNYFQTFHSTLRRAGFARREEQPEATYGVLQGIETEYEVRSGGQEYRLFVFHFHRGDQAWIVTGFFPAGRAQTHRRAYESVLRTIEFP